MKLKPQNVRIFVTPTALTDLICIACGRFRTEYEIQTNIPAGISQAGIHAKCIESVHVKRGST